MINVFKIANKPELLQNEVRYVVRNNISVRISGYFKEALKLSARRSRLKTSFFRSEDLTN